MASLHKFTRSTQFDIWGEDPERMPDATRAVSQSRVQVRLSAHVRLLAFRQAAVTDGVFGGMSLAQLLGQFRHGQAVFPRSSYLCWLTRYNPGQGFVARQAFQGSVPSGPDFIEKFFGGGRVRSG